MNPQPLLDDAVGPAVVFSIFGIVLCFWFTTFGYRKVVVFKWLISSVVWVLIVCIGSAIIYNAKWADYNRQQKREYPQDNCDEVAHNNSMSDCLRIVNDKNSDS